MENLIANIQFRQYLLVLGSVLGIFYLVLFFLMSRRRSATKPVAGGNEAQISSLEDGLTKGEPASTNLSEHRYSNEDLTVNNNDTAAENVTDDDAAFNSLEELAGKIEEVLMNSEHGNKSSLVSKLKAIINGYPQLNRLPFKVAINNVIIKRSKQHCDISISEEEVNHLWQMI